MERRNERQTQRLTGSKIERWRETARREKQKETKRNWCREMERQIQKEKNSQES